MTTQKHYFRLAYALLFQSLFFTSAAMRSNAQAVTLKADKVHSNIGFSVPLAKGLTRMTGKFNDWDITINYVDSNMAKSSVVATIKAVSISTGEAGRDEHLATPDFFDAAKYPDITFISDSIRAIGDSYIAYGLFSCHGVSNKIQLPFTMVGKDEEGNPGFTARYTIRRSDYGLGKNAETDNFISNNIAVEIDFLAKKPKNSSSK
jgi:polyisoprenoid-binding protein YceI